MIEPGVKTLDKRKPALQNTNRVFFIYILSLFLYCIKVEKQFVLRKT